MSAKEMIEKIKYKLKQLLCRHKRSQIICWHWTHGINGNEPRFIEVQRKCIVCDKYFFSYIKDREECEKFAKYYSHKEWSYKCNPIL